MSILLESYIKEQLYQEKINEEINEVTVKELVLGLGILTSLGSLAYNYTVSNSLNTTPELAPASSPAETVEQLKAGIKEKRRNGSNPTPIANNKNFNPLLAMAILTGENPDNYGVIEKGKLILTVDFIIELLKTAENSNEFSTQEQGHIFGKGALIQYIKAFEAIKKVAVKTGIPINSASKFAEWQEGFLANGNEKLARFFADTLANVNTDTDSFFNEEIEDMSHLAEVDISALMKLINKNQTGTSGIDADVYTVLSCVSMAIKNGRIDEAYELISPDLTETLETFVQQIKNLGE